MSTPATPTIGRDDLAEYLDNLLGAHDSGDWCPNGLQVEGRDEVAHLVTGVSSCQALFERARTLDADAVLVHHGLFWDGAPSVLTGIQARRVRTLIHGDMSLFAYHLPLDRDARFGNNVLAAHAFGLTDLERFAEAKGLPVGFRGRFEPGISAQELVRRCAEVYGQEPLVYDGGPETVRSLGIISGGAQGHLHDAIAAGLDAFVTGEVTEWNMNVAHESGIHYLSAGHYATERLGVRALGEHLAEHFGLRATFVDVPNPA